MRNKVGWANKGKNMNDWDRMMGKLEEIIGYVKPKGTPGNPVTEAVETKTTKKTVKTYTKPQARAKMQELLSKQGRAAAEKILKEFEAEKFGDIPETEYAKLIDLCDNALAAAPAKEEDDLDLE